MVLPKPYIHKINPAREMFHVKHFSGGVLISQQPTTNLTSCQQGTPTFLMSPIEEEGGAGGADDLV